MKKSLLPDAEVVPVMPPEDEPKEAKLMDKLFKSDDDQSADLRVMERRPKTKSKGLLTGLIVILVLAGVAAAAGFLVFNRGDKSFMESDVRISYNGDTSAGSGENIVIRLTYKNSEKATLTDSTLDVAYPSNFTYVSATASPMGEYHNQWSIGNLQPGEERILEITGQLLGEVGSSHDFSATLTYRPSNFNSEFSQKVDWKIVINSSTLSIEVKDAQEVIAGQPAAFTIEYTNSSMRDLEQVRLQPTWPDKFVVNSADPAIGNDGNWLIQRLKPNETGTIKLTGTFTGNPSDQQEIKIRAGLMDDQGDFQLQLEKSFLVLIVSQDIQLKLTVNGRADAIAVDWGQTLSVKLALTNASDFQLEQGAVSWQYEITSNNEVIKADAIEWSTLVNPKKAERSDSTLRWSSSNVDQLKTLKPGDTLELTAEVNLKPTVPAEVIGRPNLAVKITPQVSGQRTSGGSSSQFTKTGDSYAIQLNSKATLGLEARYYDQAGTAVGNGPFPPVIGRTTTFKVYLSLQNGANDINDITASLSLPDNVTWVGQGQVDAGQPLVFDPKTRLVTWRLNKLPSWTGQSTGTIMAQFSVSVSPVASQLGEYIPLTLDAALKGTDAFTQASVTQTVPGVDTSLSGDQTGAQRGRVIGQGN